MLLALGALLVAFGGGRWVGDAPVVDAALEEPVAILPVQLRGSIDTPWVPWGVAAVLAETLDQALAEPLREVPGTPLTGTHPSGTSASDAATEPVPARGAIDAGRLRDALARRALLGPGADADAVRAVAFALGARTVVEPSLRRAGEDREEGGVRLVARIHRPGGAPPLELETRGRDALEAADDLLVTLGDALIASSRTPRFASLLSGDAFLDRLYVRGLARRLGDRPAESGEDAAARAAASRPYFAIVAREAPEFTAVLAHLAEVQLASGDRSAARTSALALLERARGDRAIEARAFELVARIDTLDGLDAAAFENFAQAASRWQALGATASWARVLSARARLASSASAGFETATEAPDARDLDPAAYDPEALERSALALRRATGDALGAVSSLRRLAGHRLRQDDVEGARALLADALEIARGASDGESAGRVRGDLAGIAWRAGDADETSSQLEAALGPALAAAAGDNEAARLHLLRIHARRADAFEALEDFDAAEDAGRDALELAQDLGAERYEADAWVRLARLQLVLGYPRQARDALDQALQRDRFVRDRRALQRVIAWTAYEEGRYALAARTLGILQDAQAAGEWTERDTERLAIYQRAAAAGRRLALPTDRDG